MGQLSFPDVRRTRRSRAREALIAVSFGLLLMLAALAHASPAHAYDINDFKAGPLTKQDDDTAYYPTAGGRPPFGVVGFNFVTNGEGEPVGNTKNIKVSIPPGLIPNPQAVPVHG